MITSLGRASLGYEDFTFQDLVLSSSRNTSPHVRVHGNNISFNKPTSGRVSVFHGSDGVNQLTGITVDVFRWDSLVGGAYTLSANVLSYIGTDNNLVVIFGNGRKLILGTDYTIKNSKISISGSYYPSDVFEIFILNKTLLKSPYYSMINATGTNNFSYTGSLDTSVVTLDKTNPILSYSTSKSAYNNCLVFGMSASGYDRQCLAPNYDYWLLSGNRMSFSKALQIQSNIMDVIEIYCFNAAKIPNRFNVLDNVLKDDQTAFTSSNTPLKINRI